MSVVHRAARTGSLVLAVLLFVSCGGQPRPAPAPPAIPTANPTAWLASSVVPFNSIDINDNLDDLEPLRGIIGTARIVSLGEATHGTDEFFRMEYEEMASQRSTRDAAMAENAGWLLDQVGPDGKIVLWAHNGHIQTELNVMASSSTSRRRRRRRCCLSGTRLDSE